MPDKKPTIETVQPCCAEPNAKGCCSEPSDAGCCGCSGKFRVVLMLIAVALMLVVAVWVGLKARNAAREYNFIGVSVERNTITVTGEGRATVMPDIAKIEIGTVIEKAKVADAQKENTRIMNALHAKLAEFGIAKADIQTANYTINPSYDWDNGKQNLRGYQVVQNLRVKVRNLDKVGDILGAAGELGANQVGGIEFTVDEPEAIKEEARIKALENAKTKAEALSQVVGVKLRRVVSFSENMYEPTYNAPYAKEMAIGMGGGGSPTIQPGSAEFVLQANVTYEIE